MEVTSSRGNGNTRHVLNHCLATCSRLVCILKEKLVFEWNPADRLAERSYLHPHQEQQKASNHRWSTFNELSKLLL